MFVKLLNKKHGFTFAELMVVVGIIGVLTAVAVPIYNNLQADARQTACRATRGTIESAYAVYLADGNPATGDITALVPAYIAKMPVCPNGGEYTLANGKCTCSADRD